MVPNEQVKHFPADLLEDDSILSAAQKAKILAPFTKELFSLNSPKGRAILRSEIAAHLRSFGKLGWFFINAKIGRRDFRIFVKDCYDQNWRGGQDRLTQLVTNTPNYWIRGPRAILRACLFANHRLFLDYVTAIIRRTKARSVVELGSGSGINLLYLAKCFPEIDFVGLELTDGGVQTAREAIHQPLSGEITQWLNGDVSDRFDNKPPKNVQFLQGDATRAPFPNRSFDLAFTYLALEQMLPYQKKVLSEIARITRHHCIHIEPYWEVNSWRQRADRLLRKNFIEKRSVHQKYGWSERIFIPLYPHKVSFQSALYWGYR